eukprot:6755550-Lingulodinium_polyedra.AAC.1
MVLVLVMFVLVVAVADVAVAVVAVAVVVAAQSSGVAGVAELDAACVGVVVAPVRVQTRPLAITRA